MFRFGLHLPYDIDPDAAPGVLGIIQRSLPGLVVFPSHMPLWFLEQIRAVFPECLWIVRVKGNRAWWPGPSLDAREWDGDTTLRELLTWCSQRGQSILVQFFNEPDIEFPPDLGADNPEERETAWTTYRDTVALLISQVKAEWPHIGVSLAPLSQGNPERFAWWWQRYQESGLFASSDFVNLHLYTNGLDYADPSWGGQFLTLETQGKPVYVTEVNDNNFGRTEVGSPVLSTEDRPRHYAGFFRFLYESRKVDGATLFTLPGSKVDQQKPAWWFVDEQVIQACTTALSAPLAEPVAPAPVPNQTGGQSAQYTPNDVLQAINQVADTTGLPQVLLLALGVAESGLRWDAERWAYRNPSGKHVVLTDRALAAMANGDHSMLAGVLQEINDHGSNDISFGWAQQTVRWAPEGTQQQDIQNVLMIRDLYRNPYYAAERAAANIQGYWRQYQDVLETLCRYNKPAIPGSQNPNRANYERGIRRATEMLGLFLPEPSAPADYQPEVFHDPGFVAGSFVGMPKGVILHGSRSGAASNSIRNEFDGTRSWAKHNPQHLGWHATIGEDAISLHYSPQQWGWNAAGASDDYLGVEFAQPTVHHEITSGQIRAFLWWMKAKVLPAYPGLPLHFPTHAEVEASGETGRIFGKTDVFPPSDPRSMELRGRIMQALLDSPSSEAEMAELQALRDKVAQQEAQLTAQHQHFAVFIPSEIRRRLADPNDDPKRICEDVANELARHA